MKISRVLTFLFFVASSVLVADDWEDDDVYYSSFEVSYAGMSFICDQGCGDPEEDANLRSIGKLFRRCVNEGMAHDLSLPVVGGFFSYKDIKCPWTGRGLEYQAMLWNLEGSNSFNLETHEDFLKTSFHFRADLDYYHTIVLKDALWNLEEYRRNLPLVREIQDQGYSAVRFEEDEEGTQIPFPSNHRYSSGCRSVEWEIEFLETEIPKLEQKIQEEEESFQERKILSEEYFQKIDALYKRIFVWCLENHQPEGIAFQSAIEHLLAGEIDDAFDQIRFLLALAEQNNLSDELVAKIYLLKGQLQSELCLYADAIASLTESIQKNPLEKEAYLERAAAYFELGDFDKAIEDYLQLDPALPEEGLQWTEMAEICAGIGLGVIKGAEESLSSFVPETLASLRGLGCGLWAFCSNPVGASQQFADAAVSCIEYLKNSLSEKFIQDLVPELRVLIQSYDDLSEFEKGRTIGTIVGKYGIDIFLGKYAVTAIKHYRTLKKANQVMTLEALASPAQTQKVLKEAGKRWTHRESELKKIHIGRQGKHIQTHPNYEPNRNRSILTHPDPQKLVDQFAGTGIKDVATRGGGYREIVNCDEMIGYVIDRNTGKKIPTTKGKIHYSQNGVHIVPVNPSE